MIIKPLKGRNELVLSLIVVLLVLISSFRLTNLEIFAENFREKILSYDLGFSRFHNISDSSSGKSNKLISALSKMPSIVYKNITGYDRNHIEKLDIDIKFLDYKSILSDRDKALENKILIDPIAVKAEIKYKNQKYNAEVRLKGDLSDHWTAIHRMSLRIKLKGGNTIHGLSEFNIQKPRARVFPYDAVFQDTIRSAGNLATEHNYVKVAVNGSEWGVMDLESHINKEFLERNQKKDSLVVRFSNEDGWLYQKTNKNNANKYYRLSDPTLFSKVYSSDKNFDITRRHMYTYVVEERIKKNAELYNIDSYTKLLLLARLWGEKHVLYENNTKHYLNPYTLRLEPISSDQYHPKKLTEDGDVFTSMGECLDGFAFIMEEPYQSIKNTKEFSSNINSNYNLVLDKVSLVGSFLEEQHGYFPLDKKPSAEILNANLLVALNLGKKIFKVNDQCVEDLNSNILSKWSKTNYNLPQLIQAYHYDDGRVKIFNLLPDKLKILSIGVDDDRFITTNFEIEGHDNKSYQPYIFETNFTGIFDDRLEIVVEYQGKTKSHKLNKTLISDVNNPLIEENVQNFEFVTKKSDDTWVIPSGEWVIDSPMIVSGNLIIEPGAQLLFDDQAYLVIHGAIIANGNEQQEIRLSSKNKSWMGLYVFESKFKSILNNVLIENTSSINNPLLNLSGGVTFYKANVDITNSKFFSSLAEDMINIVESNYEIKDSSMFNTKFDALDSDFSKGYINNLIIENVGGDAIDTSGTHLTIDNFRAREIMDKAISAGELSNVKVSECFLQNVGVGIASKDGSNVSVSKCQIKYAKLSALMTYIKKGFYDQPKMDVRLSNFDVKTKFLRHPDSQLFIDEILVPYSEFSVKKLYQSTFMKK